MFTMFLVCCTGLVVVRVESIDKLALSTNAWFVNTAAQCGGGAGPKTICQFPEVDAVSPLGFIQWSLDTGPPFILTGMG